MKLAITALAAAGAIAGSVAVVSCDDVNENDRYIDMGAAQVQRNVLLEDFTGQDCMNCPKAHKVIEGQEELYGDNVIAVSIHGGEFSIPSADSWLPDFVGLASADGMAYNQSWNITSWPKGIVNRSSGLLEYDDWSGKVRDEIERPAAADISINAKVSDGVIKIETSVTPGADYIGKLQLWVVESGIVALQKDGSDYINEYVHNNVLRAAVNTLWGENFSGKGGETTTVSHSIAIRNDAQEVWNPRNLSIVAFIYNDSGVGQAERAKVKAE